MRWTVLFHGEFDLELQELAEELQDELLAHAKLLQEFGPQLGRPTVDTLKGSRHANMKELRFEWKREVWRVAFAFDPKRQAILLAGGDKGGVSQNRFYKRLIATADSRFDSFWPLSTRPRVERSRRRVAMARNLDQVISSLPAKRRARIERRASELATLKDLRRAVERTQAKLAASLGVGQDTVSRIERRSDILLSTLRRYVEALGGELKLVARFPNRPPLVIEHIAAKPPTRAKKRTVRKRSRSAVRRPAVA